MSQNGQQKITILTGFIGDIMSITISNLCLIFIPINYNIPADIFLFFFEQDPRIITVFIINTITLVLFFILYIVEVKRELWLVDHFDYSKRYSSLHLSVYKDRYPEIFSKLSKLNSNYYMAYKILKYIFLCNVILSSFIITHWFYDTYRTISTMFTNFWVCWTKITKGTVIAKDSLENGIGYSYYNVQNLSFNRIDPRFKQHVSNSNNISRVNSAGDSDSLNSTVNKNFFEYAEEHI